MIYASLSWLFVGFLPAFSRHTLLLGRFVFLLVLATSEGKFLGDLKIFSHHSSSRRRQNLWEIKSINQTAEITLRHVWLLKCINFHSPTRSCCDFSTSLDVRFFLNYEFTCRRDTGVELSGPTICQLDWLVRVENRSALWIMNNWKQLKMKIRIEREKWWWILMRKIVVYEIGMWKAKKRGGTSDGFEFSKKIRREWEHFRLVGCCYCCGFMSWMKLYFLFDFMVGDFCFCN